MPETEITTEALSCFLLALTCAFQNVESVPHESRTTRFLLNELKKNLEGTLSVGHSDRTQAGAWALYRKIEEPLQTIELYAQEPEGGVQ